MPLLLPLTFAVPLIAAGAITAVGHALGKRTDDLLGIATAAAVTVLCALLLVQSWGQTQVYWFGGWKPSHGIALGIGFAVDPLGAGLATLAALLVTVSLVFSWRFFDEVGTLYHVLMLVFLAAMVGFALTGDLFNMFVWFELMGVTAYALAGYNVDEVGPLQGALNFAITNTIGAFLILIGIGLVYGRTGALNLAQIGRSLTGHPTDPLVVVALTLILVGFMVKAAIVPFHFWLADAHAVAPAPVCVLFSGVMVELGLYGVARVYWTMFEGAAGVEAHRIRALLVGVGLVTALVGAVMCFLQRHLKRLLAYSTISHAGIFLVGIGLLDPSALGGVAAFVLAHGLLKGALFLACGIVLRGLGDVDELRLHGQGRKLRVAAIVFFGAGIGLAGPPYVGGFLGHSLLGEAAVPYGYGWLAPVLTVATLVTSAAILRGGARVFLGWGPGEDPLLSPEPEEHPSGEPQDQSFDLMAISTLTLLALGLLVSVAPGLGRAVDTAARRFTDRRGYDAAVLGNARLPHAEQVPLVLHHASGQSFLWSAVSVIGAVGLALVGLHYRRLGLQRLAAIGRPIELLRAAHSGHIGDYVAWLTFGTAGLGGLFALVLR